MSKSLLDIILDKVFDENWVGRRGEKLTERELNLVRLLGRKGKVLRNVYVPKTNGETSEIDVMFITQKGIFVFESKNYSGWIFGDESAQYWTAMLPNKEKNKFYNPIKQNQTHIKWLKEYVGNDIPLFSIVVFSERCELKKVSVTSQDVKVIKRDRTYAAVKTIWNEREDCLDDVQVNCLYEELKKLTNVDEATKVAHVENIKKKYGRESKIKSPEEKQPESAVVLDDSDNLQAKICPKCGAIMVLRTVRKGANTGNQFYGCSAFPKCRYTQNKE